MKLHTLLKIKTKDKKRIGRGIGSGKGKTSGRGMKGQKARGRIKLGFTRGGGLATYRKLPLKKGYKNPKRFAKPKLISLSSLNIFNSKDTIDLEALVQNNIIKRKDLKRGVKIVSGEIAKSITVNLPISEKAKEHLEAKGGKIGV